MDKPKKQNRDKNKSRIETRQKLEKGQDKNLGQYGTENMKLGLKIEEVTFKFEWDRDEKRDTSRTKKSHKVKEKT